MITTDDIMGKEAVDPEGSILGVVIKIHVNESSKQVTGITIDEGFMRPDLFVGIEYIKYFGIDAVLLNKVPAERFKGLRVLTSAGKQIGLVKDVVMQKTRVEKIIINMGTRTILAKKMEIPATDIREIGDSVVLKKKYKLTEFEKD